MCILYGVKDTQSPQATPRSLTVRGAFLCIFANLFCIVSSLLRNETFARQSVSRDSLFYLAKCDLFQISTTWHAECIITLHERRTNSQKGREMKTKSEIETELNSCTIFVDATNVRMKKTVSVAAYNCLRDSRNSMKDRIGVLEWVLSESEALVDDGAEPMTAEHALDEIIISAKATR